MNTVSNEFKIFCKFYLYRNVLYEDYIEARQEGQGRYTY